MSIARLAVAPALFTNVPSYDPPRQGPDAYEDVWICTHPRGHLQATGRDARLRKQYRYHPDWWQVRDGAKFERMVEFGEALPRLRSRLRRDLALNFLRRRSQAGQHVKIQ